MNDRLNPSFTERHTALAWIWGALAILSITAFWVIITRDFGSPPSLRVALLLVALLLLCGFSFLKISYHWTAAEALNPGRTATYAELTTALDGARPVAIYLRNFSIEHAVVQHMTQPKFDSNAPASIRGPSLPIPDVTHGLERAIWHQLQSDFDFFAIENSIANTVPYFKTVQCEQHDWQRIVTHAVDKATLVVLAIEELSPGVAFEVELVERSALHRTWLISTQNVLPKLEERWPTLVTGAQLYTAITTAGGLRRAGLSSVPLRATIVSQFLPPATVGGDA